MAGKQCRASYLGLFPRHSRLFSFEMEKRDQQQPRQQQPQVMAPFAIEQNWQETVGMSLLSSIGSSCQAPRRVRTTIWQFQGRCPPWTGYTKTASTVILMNITRANDSYTHVIHCDLRLQSKIVEQYDQARLG